MISRLPIDQFIKQLKTYPIIDARSPAEFAHACVPWAVNIPLLNNEERSLVGITYKNQGNQNAVVKGYELTGHKFSSYITKALELAPNKKINLYCWRGGLRSQIMAFLLHSAGFDVYLLEGGYKEFRKWVLFTLSQSRNLRIVGGKTGSGKTLILHELKQLNQYVIDLEELASHKGSVFGGLGQKEQPSVEMFENKLALQWHDVPMDKVLWLENESRNIGRIRIPQPIFNAMQQALVYVLESTQEKRVLHISKEYGTFDYELLKNCTRKLEKKLGNLRMQQALELLNQNNLNQWIEMMLVYYDKSYIYGKQKRKQQNTISINTENKSFKETAQLLLNYLQKEYECNKTNTI